MTLRYGSLFSGYGGLDMAVQSVLGGETAWFVEFDKAPSKILAHHWPDVPNYGDITKVDFTKVEPVDVLTGGSPCQDLSHAGKRAGMTEGTRSNLWVQMREAINVLRPRLVVWENVRGALSAEATSDLEPCAGCMGDPGDGRAVLRALGRVLGDLAELGYDARWYGLRAADVGAAHGRFRVFLFATPVDADTLGSGWDGRAPEQVGRAVARAPATGGGEGSSPTVDGDLTLLPTPAVNDMGASYTPETWDAWTAKMQAAHGNGNGHGKSLAIEAQRLLPTPRATDGTKGGPNQRGSSGDLMLPSAVNLLPTPRVTQAGYADDGRGGKSLDVEGRKLGEAMNHATVRTDMGRTGNRRHCTCGLDDDPEYPINPDDGHMHDHDCPAWVPPIEWTPTPGRWGDYAAAIARWEHVIGRPAPDPTEPGAKGNPRLSASFVEWLMGLPAGHVTNAGLTRNEALKALGNGVVPQQAAAATWAFINDTRRETAA